MLSLLSFHSLHAYFFYSIVVTMMLNQAAVAFNRFVTVCYTHNPPFQVQSLNFAQFDSPLRFYNLFVLKCSLADEITSS